MTESPTGYRKTAPRVGWLLLDRHYAVVKCSALMHKWTGVNALTLCGTTLGEWGTHFSLDSSALDGLIHGASLTISPVYDSAGEAAQNPETLEVSASPMGDEILLIFYDISDFVKQQRLCKQNEAELMQRRQQDSALNASRLSLEKTVSQRTRELRKSLEEIELANMRLLQANKHKDRFMSTMSHELRTPLNAVLGFSDLLKTQFFGELNEKQLEYVDQIDSSSRHLLALISDLLDIAKIDAGSMELSVEDIPVEELVYAVYMMMMPQFREKEMNVNTRISPELTVIEGDRRKLKQIMLNLLSNAVKFTSKKGNIDIVVEPQEGAAVLFKIVDTGIGIQQHELSKIFTEFYQTRCVRDNQYGGTGIGLALTKKLTELHHGQIGVESEPDKGSTFWFRIPLRQQPDENRTETSPPAQITVNNAHGARILIAEDEPANLKLLSDMLNMLGHKVLGAYNGAEALQYAESFKPDLILMDIRMPVMDGFEATRALRKIETFTHTPIIALTAYASGHAEQECLECGCSGYIPKPVESARLCQLLNFYLSPKKGIPS